MSDKDQRFAFHPIEIIVSVTLILSVVSIDIPLHQPAGASDLTLAQEVQNQTLDGHVPIPLPGNQTLSGQAVIPPENKSDQALLILSQIANQNAILAKQNALLSNQSENTWETPIAIGGLLGGLAGGVFAGVGLLYTSRSIRESSKAQFFTILRQLHDEVVKLESSDERRKQGWFEVWAVKYLNLLNEIAYYANSGYMSREIAEWFRLSFKDGMSILNDPKLKDKYESEFKDMRRWCEDEDITPQQTRIDQTEGKEGGSPI